MIRSVIWNLSGMAAVAATMLVTTPLFLHYFGAERYGILATIWMVFGYFSVLDFGMGPAIISFLSRPDRQDGEGASGVFWTAVLMNLAVGIGIGAILALVLHAIGAGNMAAGPIRDELTTALPWLVAMLPVSLIYPILVGALDARRLFGIANANQVAGTVAAQVLPLVAVLLVRPTLTVAIAGTVLGRALSAILLLLFCMRRLDLASPRFERALVRELMSFGGWVALSGAVGSILETADRLVVTTLLGGTAAAWYAISYNVVTRARVLPQAVMRALFPEVAADAEGDDRSLRQSARVLAILLVPMLATGMVLLEPMCQLWIGATATASVVPIARLMLLGIYANCLAFVSVLALQARGQPARLAKVHLWETPVFLVVMYLATMEFGIVGAAAAWSLRLVVDAAVLLWITNMRRVLRIDLFAQLLVPAAAMAIAMLLPGGWPAQLAAVSALLAVWMIADTLIAVRTEGVPSIFALARWLLTRIRRPA